MRLCYIAPPDSIHTERWLKAFVERGHEVHLIVLPGVVRKMEGVIFHPLPDGYPKIRFARWVGSTRRIIRQIRPDLLHGHYLTRYGWLAAFTFYRPLVLTAWETDIYMDPEHTRLAHLLTAWSLPQASLVTAVSRDLCDSAIRLGARKKVTEVIHWGVDPLLFRRDTDTSALRLRLGLDRGPVILTTRNISPIYNHDVLLSALPSVLKAVPGTTLLFKYSGYDAFCLRELRALADRLGLKGEVRFVGEGSHGELPSYYALADVFVSIASSDGAPVSLLEAMACGSAPIVSDLPSLREWIVEGQNGCLVAPRDVQGLADTIVRVLRSQDLRQRFAGANRPIIEERADHRVEMKRAEGLYQSLIRPGNGG
jgi:L-malate glycosyltransferase